MTNLYGYVCVFSIKKRTMETYKAIFKYCNTVYFVDRNRVKTIIDAIYCPPSGSFTFSSVRDYRKRKTQNLINAHTVYIVVPSKYKVSFTELYHEFFDYLGLSTISEEEKQRKINSLKKSIECSVKSYDFHNKRMKEEEQRIKDLQTELTTLENLK